MFIGKESFSISLLLLLLLISLLLSEVSLVLLSKSACLSEKYHFDIVARLGLSVSEFPGLLLNGSIFIIIMFLIDVFGQTAWVWR